MYPSLPDHQPRDGLTYPYHDDTNGIRPQPPPPQGSPRASRVSSTCTPLNTLPSQYHLCRLRDQHNSTTTLRAAVKGNRMCQEARTITPSQSKKAHAPGCFPSFSPGRGSSGTVSRVARYNRWPMIFGLLQVYYCVIQGG